MQHIKQAAADPATEDRRVRETVEGMLADIERRREDAVVEYAARFDDWHGEFILSDGKRRALIDSVPDQVKDDIGFAHRQVTRFAEALGA